MAKRVQYYSFDKHIQMGKKHMQMIKCIFIKLKLHEHTNPRSKLWVFLLDSRKWWMWWCFVTLVTLKVNELDNHQTFCKKSTSNSIFVFSLSNIMMVLGVLCGLIWINRPIINKRKLYQHACLTPVITIRKYKEIIQVNLHSRSINSSVWFSWE